MNKIFRIIWNHAQQNWVVTSELAKGHTKAQSSKSFFQSIFNFKLNALATTLALFLVGGEALAADPICVSSTGTNSIACGVGAIASGAKSVAVGSAAQAMGMSTLVLGDSAYAGMSINKRNVINDSGAIVIGRNAYAAGTNDFARTSTQSDGTTKQYYYKAKDGGWLENPINPFSEKLGAAQGIALGVNAVSNTQQTIAIGNGAEAGSLGADGKTNTQGIAIGQGAKAYAHQAISIGRNANAYGDSGIALGNDGVDRLISRLTTEEIDKLKNNANIGVKRGTYDNTNETVSALKTGEYPQTTAGTGSIAIGSLSSAADKFSTAIGLKANASGFGTMAVGVGAQATKENAMALGTGSNTDSDASEQTRAKVNGITYDGFAGSTNISVGDQVSFGSAGFERQLKNVAAGEISDSSTDAINGSQLYVVANELSKKLTHYYSVKDNGSKEGNYENDGATAPYSIAAGVSASATERNASALGYNAKATSQDSTAIGANANAKGDAGYVYPGSSVQGKATAVGANATAGGTSSVALGDSSNAKSRADIAVGMGAVANSISDGRVNYGNFTDYNLFWSISASALAMGAGANATGRNAVALGVAANAFDAYATAVGSGAKANISASALGYLAQATGDSAVSIGTFSKATEEGEIAIGRDAAGEDYDKPDVGNKNGISLGRAAGFHQVSGERNVAIGYASGRGVAGSSNLAIMENAGLNTAGNNNIAIGNNANKFDTVPEASDNNIAIGTSTQARGNTAVAIGYQAKALAANAISIGNGNIVTGENSGSIGDPTTITGSGTYNMGNNNGTISVDNAGVIGNDNTLTDQATASRVVGNNNYVNGSESFVLGNDVKVQKDKDGTSTRVIGIGSNVTVRDNDSIAIGTGTYTDGNFVTAMGNKANASGDQAVAIGSNTVARESSTALGQQAQATGNTALAVGAVAKAGGNQATAVGQYSNAAGASSTAIGPEALAGKKNAVALGYQAKATEGGALALGYGAQATVAGAVALGENSVTGGAVKTASATVNGITYSGFAGSTIGSSRVVSVGTTAEGQQRQIQNVAAGRINSTSTDAINGSQLYMVANTLGNVANTTTNILGGDAALDPATGNITMTDIGGTGKNTVNDAIRAAKTEVKPGTNVTDVATSTDATDGHTIYTVNANGTTVSKGSDLVKVTPGTKDANNVTDYAVDLSDGAKASLGKADTALQSWVAKIDDAEVKTITKDDNSLSFTAGDNITLSNEDGKIKIASNINANGAVENGNTGLVNGGTVYNAIEAAKTRYYSVNSNDQRDGSNYNNDGAKAEGALAAGVGTRALGANDVAVGSGAVANSSDNTGDQTAVAVGYNAAATGLGAVAIGGAALAQVANMVSVGYSAGSGSTTEDGVWIGTNAGNSASGVSNIGIGEFAGSGIGDTNPNSNYNLAMGIYAGGGLNGSNNLVLGTSAGSTLNGDDNVALGNAAGANLSGSNNIAIGRQAGTAVVVNNDPNNLEFASGGSDTREVSDSISLGNNAQALKDKAIAIGLNTQAKNENDVALGAGAISEAAVGTTDATVNKITYNGFTGTSPIATLSVGSAGNERTITNVAAGRVSNTSTDAINGSQLYAVANELSGRLTHYYSVNDNGKQGANYNNDGATGINALAAGVGAKAAGESVVSIGKSAGSADANANKSVYIGDSAGDRSTTNAVRPENVYIGHDAGKATAGGWNTAIGTQNAGAGITGDLNVALGHATLYKVTGDENTGLGAYAGQNSTGNYNTSVGSQAGRYIQGSNNTSVGYNAGANTVGSNNVALGNEAGQAVTMNDTLSIGNAAKANAQNGDVALGANAVTATVEGTDSADINGLVYGGFAGNDPKSTVSVGKKGAERTITNVAAGRISSTSTDAINGSQLYAVADTLGNVANSVVSNLGGNAEVDEDGNITMTNIGGTEKDTVDDAIKAAKTEVVQGKQVTVTSDVDKKDGHTIYTVNATKTTVTGSGDVVVTGGTEDDQGVIAYTADLSQTTKDNIQKGVDAKDTIDTLGVNFGGDTGKTFARQLGEQANVKGGATGNLTDANIGVVSDGKDTLNIKLAKDIDLTDEGSLTIGDTLVMNDIIATDTVTANNVNVGGTTITNGKVDGLEDRNARDDTDYGVGDNATRAATESAVKKVDDKINNAKFGLKAQDNNTVVKNLDETIDVMGADSNISTKVVGEQLQIELAKTLDLGKDGSVTMGDTNVDGNGLTITGGPSITKGGINAGGNKITNVAPGTDPTDAVNKSQLDEVAGNAAKHNTLVGTAPITVDDSEKNAEGGIKYKIGVTTSALAANANGSINAPTNTDALITAANVANAINASGFTLTTSQSEGKVEGTTKELVNPGETVTIDAGKNIKVTQAAGKITVATIDKPNFSEVTIGDKNGDNTVLTSTKDGLDVGGDKITNVASGGDVDTNAANIGDVKNAVNNGGWNIQGNGTPNGKVVNNNTVNFVNGTGTTATVTGTDGSYSVKYDVNKTTFNTDGSGNVSAVENGDNFATAKDVADAINNAQKTVEVVKGTNIASVDSQTEGKTTTFTVNAKGTTVSVSDDLALTIDSETDKANNITDYKVALSEKTKEDIKKGVDAKNTVDTKGVGFAGDSGNAFTRKLGEQTNVKGGVTDETTLTDNNIGVVSDGNDTLTIKLAKDLKDLNSVSANTITAGDTTMNTDGITINNGKAGKPVSLTKDGLDNGGNKITNVADGTADTDAVNVSQLEKAQKAATTKVLEGKNIRVTETANTDGSKTYKVATADDLDVNSITAGDTVLNKDGVKAGDTVLNKDGVKVGDNVALTKDGLKVGDVNITTDGINAGNNKVTGVADGDISATSKDAVNGSQLYNVQQAAKAAKTEVEAGDNIKVTSTTGGNGQTIYTVATKKDVSFDNVNVGGVSINKDTGINAGNNKVTGVAAGDVNANSTDAVNGSQLHETNQNVAKNAANIANNTAAINKGLNFTADDGKTLNRQLGDTVAVNGDENITTSVTSSGVKVALNKNLKVDSVTAGNTVVNNDGVTIGTGDKAVSLTQNGLNNGGNRITNVAPGKDPTDAVNVAQLSNVANHLDNKVNKVAGDMKRMDKKLRAGIAGAAALGMLPQPTRPGKSMVSVGGTTYRNESAVALGVSRVSDNEKWVIKVGASANTRNNYIVGGSVGYQW
ncbi:YadA-like family protein [Avibacterium volantium]|uniref:YadA-like family protein n=1 Tax=Avibacterium TaxID=292486 RepID=UPI0039FC28F0